jgi:hypothetical protein
MPVDPRLAEVALEYVDGTNFERFFQAFFPEIAGRDFVPLGGMHDGGADAFDSDNVYEGKSRATSFYQASVEQNHKAKIRRTVARRDVRTLTYVSSRQIPLVDRDEEELGDDLDVTIRIRPRNWIATNINRSAATEVTFEAYLRPCVAFLSDVGRPGLLSDRQ